MPERIQAEEDRQAAGAGAINEPLHELTLGRSLAKPAPLPPRPPSALPAVDEGLELLVRHCYEKAEAARWAAERQRRILERDNDLDEFVTASLALKEWAEKLTDAYYWACTGGTGGSAELSKLDDVGGCFETLAESLRLLLSPKARRAGLEKALALVAESQSALRLSLQRLGIQGDPDQLSCYDHVRETAAAQRIFLKRFMRADELAEPGHWPGLLARSEGQLGGGTISTQQQAQLATLASLCEQSEAELTAESWSEIVGMVERLVSAGLPPSNRELREILMPVLDQLPGELLIPPELTRVVQEIDRFLASRATGAGLVEAHEVSEEVRRAARLLAGRTAVLIGGIRRPQVQEILRAGLGLRELVWFGTRVHQSVRTFEAAVSRPEVAVVLLAIRWSSHSFGDVKQYCERHGKPLVRLPGGYNLSQVAAQILSQCSEQLDH